MKATLEFNLDNLTDERIRQIVREEIAKVLGNTTASNPKKDNPDMKAILSKRIEDLGLSVRTYNITRYAEINTISDLVSLTRNHLRCFPHIGFRTMQEFDNLLRKFNLDYEIDVREYGFTPHPESIYSLTE